MEFDSKYKKNEHKNYKIVNKINDLFFKVNMNLNYINKEDLLCLSKHFPLKKEKKEESEESEI